MDEAFEPDDSELAHEGVAGLDLDRAAR